MNRILLMILTAALHACVTNSESSVQIPPDPRQDREYYPIYQQFTTYREVIHQFATHYSLHVTRLSPTFRGALGERYQKIFNEPQPMLGEVTARTGFFVTIFVADPEFRQFEDEGLWNIQLKSNGKIAKPILVQRLRPKEKWAPFFPGINPWSHEYLVLFDEAPAADGPHELLKAPEVELILSSILGRTTLKW